MDNQQKFWWGVKTALYLLIWGLFIYNAYWYVKLTAFIWCGLLFQSGFFHRYAAHQVYTMSPGMVKVAYVLSWIFQGTSYLSAYVYGVMHRIHHAFVDTKYDPHSPNIDNNAIDMMIRTGAVYNFMYGKDVWLVPAEENDGYPKVVILQGNSWLVRLVRRICFRFHIIALTREYFIMPIPDKYKKNVPRWEAFDRIAHVWVSRLIWAAIYIALFLVLAIKVDHVQGAEWIVVILCMIMSFVMGPFHGLIVNWYGHTTGYRNYHTNDLSRNIGNMLFAIFMNILFFGEDKHNNHHQSPSAANFAHKWWEYDLIYTILVVLEKCKIIKLKTANL